ncbi:MAG: putative DNA binding domain-containing protein [Prevotella sp.]|nr:putative DNA binding domain-containing protein [Prevotella sp.]
MDLKTLIAECTAYDFKVMLEEKKPKSWLKSVSAFANGLGGSLFFGMDNNGVVKGLDDVQRICEVISGKIRDYMDPLPEVEMIPHDVDGLHVLQLKVNSGHYTPYYYVGDGQRVAFIRVGDESIPATDEDMKRLVLKGTNRSYDSLKSESLTEKSTFVILANTFEERTEQKFQKKFLKSFGLITDEGWLTNAGALFSDNCRLSQSRLYCTRWNGLEKDDAINDAEFSGNILLLLREAMNFVKSNTRKGWEKLPDGRKNMPEYAERAVLEALVNHFIHRDYTVMGGEVHLDIYDDRIAITTPGGMYSGQLVQDLQLDDISSERRNPILADVMAQLDYMEKRGSGLKKICNETKKLITYKEERKPVFKSTATQFMTIIYSMEYEPTNQRGERHRTKQGLSWDQVGTKIGLSWDEVKKLFIALQESKSLGELKDLYGWSNTTKFKVKFVSPLIEEQFVGMTFPDKPTSPKQRYFLTDSGKALLANMTCDPNTNDLVDKVNHIIGNLSEDEKRLALDLLQKG